MKPNKVRNIFEWHVPKNNFDVRSFHGFAGFYNKVIKQFSMVYLHYLMSVLIREYFNGKKQQK
jgi:hypothetical protein